MGMAEFGDRRITREESREECRNCGFTWHADTSKGTHDCWEVKDARYEALREASEAVVDNAVACEGIDSTVETMLVDALAKLLKGD